MVNGWYKTFEDFNGFPCYSKVGADGEKLEGGLSCELYYGNKSWLWKSGQTNRSDFYWLPGSAHVKDEWQSLQTINPKGASPPPTLVWC